LSRRKKRGRTTVAMETISWKQSPSIVGFTRCSLRLHLVGQTLPAFPIPTLTLHWIASTGISLRKGGSVDHALYHFDSIIVSSLGLCESLHGYARLKLIVRVVPLEGS